MLKKKSLLSKTPATKLKPKKYSLPSIIDILNARIDGILSDSRKVNELKQNLSVEAGKLKTSENPYFILEKVWRTDLTMGRSTSYYDLEEQQLGSNVEYVAAAHNCQLIQGEIERRRREIAWNVARDFPPLNALPEDERLLAMYLAGATPPTQKGMIPLPTDVASKYSIIIKQRDQDDYEPDKEILEVMQEDINRLSEEDLKNASIREAGSVEPGGHLNICFGSSG